MRAIPLKKLVKLYLQSSEFNRLRDQTKLDYTRFLKILTDTLGETTASVVSGKDARMAYEEWVTRGIHLANHVAAVAGIVYRHGQDMEYVKSNPFTLVRKLSPVARNTVWTQDQVRQFLDVAYGDFVYRNVGLIVQMAYEWCQRVGDMRMLTWDSIDFNTRRLRLLQSKRGAEVQLPISDALHDMLTEQQQDFDFQKYVAPMPSPRGGEYKPFSMERLSKIGRIVMRQAQLPDELRLMDLRRTGTTEMVEAGVPLPQIMSVTGHANPQSVKPYIKNTYLSANSALTARQQFKED
jgi:integrase